MKKTILKVMAAVTVVAVLFALCLVEAFSQPTPAGNILNPVRIRGGGAFTNRVAGSTAWTMGTNTGARLSMGSARYAAIQLQGNLNGAGTTAFSIGLSRNVDGGTNREVFATLAVTASGTTPVVNTTNIDMGAYPYVYIEYITNASATGSSYLTNWIVTASTK